MRRRFLIMFSMLCLLFASCNEYAPFGKKEMFQATFENYIGGPIDPSQTWGFYNLTRAAMPTRGLVPEIDDPFEEFNDIDHLYLEELPKNVNIEIATSSTPWWEYPSKNGDFEFKNGEYTVGCWNASPDYKLTFYITGDNVTINANGLHSARFYVLPGATLTLTGSAIHNFRIFVSHDATLNYTRDEIETQGWYWDPVKGENTRTTAAIFNRGTVEFTGTKCDIRSGAVVYNEGYMHALEIDCNSGEGQHSYLYNYGELRVQNDDDGINGDFILNGSANFYNEGEVYVDGCTKFTKAGSHWINKGHYYTEDMEFMGSHGNTDKEGAYNYCQLIVRNTFIYRDGTFTLMPGAYIEADYADFRNFDVEMWGHAGININKGSVFAANADSDRQGFHGDSEEWSYVRLGGTTTLPDNSNSFNIDGKVIFGIENLKDHSVGNVNQAMNIGPDAVEVPFSAIDAEEDTEDCYVKWTPETPGDEPEEPKDPEYPAFRIIVEDLPATIESLNMNASDFDYNDVVFDATFKETTIDITVHACGGTLPLFVAGVEVHGLFGLPTTTIMTNKYHSEREPITFTIKRNGINNANDIPVWVEYKGFMYEIKSFAGEAPAKICVGLDYVWCDERVDIKKTYPKFVEWAKSNPADWETNYWYK